MKLKIVFALALTFGTLASGALSAQDLPQNIRKISDGIYVYVGNNFNSNCGIVMTQEGVVLIDSGHNPSLAQNSENEKNCRARHGFVSRHGSSLDTGRARIKISLDEIDDISKMLFLCRLRGVR